MELVTILEEQTVAMDAEAGQCVITGVKPLITGETYIVVWNGVVYERVATDLPITDDMVAPVIGNNIAVTGEGDDPFVVAYADSEISPDGEACYAVMFLDGSTSATIAIYQGTADEEPEEEERIVLKDRNGNDITFQGINILRVKTPSGGTKTFAACDYVEKTVDPDFSDGDFVVLPDTGTLLSKVTVEKPEALSPENIRKGKEIAGVTGDFIGDTESVTVELALADGDQTVSPSADGKVISGVTITKPANLVPENIAKDVDIAGVTGSLEVPETVETSVALDFSAGDMKVVPESGQAFSKIDIPVPDTLIPEKIAEGWNIAGILGTMAAGGGSGAKVAYGKQRLSLNNVLTHNLGVIPDIVLIWHVESNAVSGGHTAVWIGLSAKFRDAIGISDSSIDQNKRYYKVSTTNYFGWVGVAKPIETTTATAPINNANETTLNVYGSSSGKLNWLAIGGLT